MLILDVASEESVERAVRNVLKRFGKIDILVNNAGVRIASAPSWRIQCLRSRMHSIQMSMVSPIHQKEKIINVGSIFVLVPGPWIGAYAASKAALHSFTDSLRSKSLAMQFIVVKSDL
ncbi:putative oxidoreductase [Cinnamomum micranthum f. kanehirae]|uniref:Putative oxidoreductase n=1 Tax=Cinnamomum micranthum f. kanehirae TaxID=337451 RepID=A0A3S3PL21_9MAGN|nr:putative oxidoreductase [Cinnamomum micranthum f. kanehirae]